MGQLMQAIVIWLGLLTCCINVEVNGYCQGQGTFECHNGACISETKHCDGHVDCTDGSDEVDCNQVFCKEPDWFRCRNGRCISSGMRCDDDDDCGDWSDEDDCHIEHVPKNCTDSEWRCMDNNCIIIDWVCDGRQDCMDGSDELQGKITCRTAWCNHRCIPTPQGPQCVCQTGYTMAVNNTCVDIDECLEYGICDQKCLNMPGKYDCYCDEGYELAEDKRTCRATGADPLLVFASTDEIRGFYIKKDFYFVIASKLERAVGISYDRGHVYWTDLMFGEEAIVRSSEDGSHVETLVTAGLYEPEDLMVDWVTENIYFTDAEAKHIGVCSNNGSMCTVLIILQNEVKHPYSIAVFEDTLYWSDWQGHDIQACNKFTGKNHRVVVREKSKKKFIYGIHVYHPAMISVMQNPCKKADCSDLCLLAPNRTYTCACPEHKVRGADMHSCHESLKQEVMIVAANNKLYAVGHQFLGKQTFYEMSLQAVNHIGAITYNSLTGHLVIFDAVQHKLFNLGLKTMKLSQLASDVGYIDGMDFDYLGNNIYLCDGQKATIEILSLTTLERTVLLHSFEGEVPLDIAVVPEEGIMFIAMSRHLTSSENGPHIDRMTMDGREHFHIVESGLDGPIISLHYDKELHRVFWTDPNEGQIGSAAANGMDQHIYKHSINNPSDVASLGRDLFWTDWGQPYIYWANKFDGESRMKRLMLVVCSEDKFKCKSDNLCIPRNFRCNGRKDCQSGEDELDCEAKKCLDSQFTCKNGQCISIEKLCNGERDCLDGSDEKNCEKCEEAIQFKCSSGECVDIHDRCDHYPDCTDVSCPPTDFKCHIGVCVPKYWVCDGEPDCIDGTDELNCGKFIFWIEISKWNIEIPKSILIRADMSGENRKTLVNEHMMLVYGIALDVVRKRIFIADEHQNTIESMGYSGEDRHVVVDSNEKPINLALFEGTLYWLTSGTGQLTSYKLYGPPERRFDKHQLYSYGTEHFAILQASMQPIVVNPCANHTCDEMCVLSPSGYPVCLCFDGTIVEMGKSCPKEELHDGSRSSHGLDSSKESGGTQAAGKSSAGLVMGLIIIAVIIATLLGAYYYKYRGKKNSKFGFSMHFQNPTFGVRNSTENPSTPPQGLVPGQHQYTNPFDSSGVLEHPDGKVLILSQQEKPPVIIRIPSQSSERTDAADFEMEDDTSQEFVSDNNDMKAPLIS
ncbi:hypothetical protein C0J52_19350 [Blattella germanica]|nr:hypothetical protein C0J52_19350 [Blattella germanica]